jgi:uncharacterized protein YgfB (UPF0149 family)
VYRCGLCVLGDDDDDDEEEEEEEEEIISNIKKSKLTCLY